MAGTTFTDMLDPHQTLKEVMLESADPITLRLAGIFEQGFKDAGPLGELLTTFPCKVLAGPVVRGCGTWYGKPLPKPDWRPLNTVPTVQTKALTFTRIWQFPTGDGFCINTPVELAMTEWARECADRLVTEFSPLYTKARIVCLGVPKVKNLGKDPTNPDEDVYNGAGEWFAWVE